MKNINQVARATLLDKLRGIANTGNAGALQNLLAGAGLPALSRDAEPAEQIYDALASDPHYASLARRIAHLLATLIRLRAESLAQRLAKLEASAIGGSGVQVYESPQLEDETYVFNQLLLAAYLPRCDRLFDSLRYFHEVGFEREVILASINNRIGTQLRRALAEQQHDHRLRGYWLNLLQDRQRTWNPARRTELFEAWRGLLNTLDLNSDKHDALDTLNTGLLALHGSVEPHPQSIDLLELALLRLENAFPLDPSTWVSYLVPFWQEWPGLLQDVAARIWPTLRPKQHEEMPPLPDDLAELCKAMGEEQQNRLLDFLRRNAADEGRGYLLGDLQFTPPMVAGRSPQEVRALLKRLSIHLWPEERKERLAFPRFDLAEWGEIGAARPARRGAGDRLDRLEAVNRTLVEIERRLSEGDEALAHRYLDELLIQQRNDHYADRHLHVAKTLANAATIIMRFGLLDWAERLWREACSENSEDVVSACGLADVLKARGELEVAEAQYRSNMERWPNDEFSACGLADVLKVRGELGAAETQYRSNMERWPNGAVSANGLAEVLKARGELEAAEAQYRSNMAHWPNDEVSACGLAEVLKARGELEAAEAQYRSNMARWPNDEVSACGLAEVLKARGELEAAEAQYRSNMARWPNNVVLANGLAEVLKARGELEAAEAQYRSNMARWPNDRVVRNGLANVLRKLKRHADALALLQESSVVVPITNQNCYDLHLRAMVLLDLGRLEDARSALRTGLQAVIGSQQQAIFHRAQALLELRAKDFKQAEKILSGLPGNVAPLDLIRLHLEAAQNHGEAATRLDGTLSVRQPRMNFGEMRVLELVRNGFGLAANEIGRQPREEELDEIFDAEIELLLAA